MNKVNVLKKNKHFYISMILNTIEGMLSGCNFIVLLDCIRALWQNNLSTKLLLNSTAALGVVFLIRIIIYSIGYTEGQIGGADVSRQIRLFLGDKIKKIPLFRFTKGQTGEYINVATNDVNNYEKILTHKAGDIAKNGALSVMLIIFVCTIYVPAGMIILIGDLMLLPTLWVSFRAVKKYGNEKNSVMANNVSNIVEYITGIQTFRAYGIGGTKNKVVTDSMRSYSNISYVYEKNVIPIGMVFSILSWLTLPLMILIAWHGYSLNTFDAPILFMLSLLPIFSCKLAGVIFVDLTSYKNLTISKWHINNIIDEKEEVERDLQFTPNVHDIEFEDVTFSYDRDKNVLNGVSFSAEDKKLTAIVGDSGSGKSTILNLISKYYESDSGDIKIGNVSTRNVDAVKVLSQISMVDQDVFLFNDTIRNNIRYARPSATDKEIEEACRLANCEQFINQLDLRYDTLVGENGNLFSGGERQRLSIARAIIKDSPIILLDEATASLDIENELAVKNAISNLLRDKKTVIMVAHTLSIIEGADNILVVDNGIIRESGTHRQLLDRKGKYYNMWSAEQKLNDNIMA
ncbi:ABC transporter [Vallitalea longa]|uniref:ABC transporter n=1 Tax=Vallitalea longa TaxID=2936439 RepID=A0A9W6DD67_9FIRM|nr:ABC transporter ATP-binding protein [Vallitalea longa]GKX27615.1 ABC transporter [Vallitalea longa]